MPNPERIWTLRPATDPSPALIEAAGGNEFVAMLLARRGITEPGPARAYLDPQQYQPAPPAALVGLNFAAELLYTAINRRQRILVWGDFDVDGQTSTALLVAALRRLSDTERALDGRDDDSAVAFHIPNRFSEGHGILPELLAEKLENAAPPFDLLLTCDTGIDEGPAIGYAKDKGLTVIVTDHHDLGAELLALNLGVDSICGLTPPVVAGDSVRRADAIVNPKLQPPNDPLRTLPGVGVAYKLIQALYAQCDRAGDEEDLLDLVALGIVADVAEQVADARYLLQRGLERLRVTRRTGLLALMEIARLNPATVSATDIGFQIGPRMNALGRMEDATVAVELLTTRDAIRAGQLAARMERLNQQRRLLTTQITATAFEILAREPSLLDYNALVLAHPAWHAGIVGIVASRLVEEYQKPVVLLLTPPDGPARGSARSVPGVDIGSAIAGCSHLLLGHGGHPGAAGVSLLLENVDRFRRELSRQVEVHRTDDVQPGLVIDGELTLDQIDLALAESLQRLAPFGQGNPTPYFISKDLHIQDDRRMGRDGSHRRLTVAANPEPTATGKAAAAQPVLWFNGGDVELADPPLDLVYSVEINEFRGERSVQLHYVDSRASAVAVPTTTTPTTPGTSELAPLPGASRLTVHDLRHGNFAIGDLPSPPQAIWYAEGTRLGPDIAYAPRTACAVASPDPAPTSLVIWTPPPSPSLLLQLVADSQVSEIYLCGSGEVDDRTDGVLQNVAAMCKFALERDRRVDLERMAARLGLTDSAIRYSLLWLERKGLIDIQAWHGQTIAEISADAPIGAGTPQLEDREAAILRAELESVLAEIRAYRRYFRRAAIKQLGLDAKPTATPDKSPENSRSDTPHADAA
ncbi:MAG: DHH family phosphoesterase [Litorilinea sp.]